VELWADEQGSLHADGPWRTLVPWLPVVSLAHSGTLVAAIAGRPDVTPALGIDIERLKRPGGADHVTLAPSELALLAPLPQDTVADWRLRVWCAREAVRKALRWGPHTRPLIAADAIDATTGRVRIVVRQGGLDDGPLYGTRSFLSYTARSEDAVVATTLAESGGPFRAQYAELLPIAV
jgi:hypothetical protein